MAKIGRNQPCPCGSGKKYKRCCLAMGVPAIGFSAEKRQTALSMLQHFVETELSQEDDAAFESF